MVDIWVNDVTFVHEMRLILSPGVLSMEVMKLDRTFVQGKIILFKINTCSTVWFRRICPIENTYRIIK